MSILQEDVMRTKFGDNEAFNRLLDAYKPMITSLVSEISRSYPAVNIDKEDLNQEALISLYFSTLSYKADKGVSFGLYAKICIKNRLTSYVQNSISKSLYKTVSECIDDCFDENGFMPEPAADDNEQPLNQIISKESCDMLKKRIKAELTDYEYNVFMCYADGMKPADISKKLKKKQQIRLQYAAKSTAKAQKAGFMTEKTKKSSAL